jgi:hypothetical protein
MGNKIEKVNPLEASLSSSYTTQNPMDSNAHMPVARESTNARKEALENSHRRLAEYLFLSAGTGALVVATLYLALNNYYEYFFSAVGTAVFAVLAAHILIKRNEEIIKHNETHPNNPIPNNSKSLWLTVLSATLSCTICGLIPFQLSLTPEIDPKTVRDPNLNLDPILGPKLDKYLFAAGEENILGPIELNESDLYLFAGEDILGPIKLKEEEEEELDLTHTKFERGSLEDLP